MTTNCEIDVTAKALREMVVRVKFSLEDMDDMGDAEEDVEEDAEEIVNHLCVILALSGHSGWEDVESEGLIEHIWIDRENQVALLEMPEDVYRALCAAGCEFLD